MVVVVVGVVGVGVVIHGVDIVDVLVGRYLLPCGMKCSKALQMRDIKMRMIPSLVTLRWRSTIDVPTAQAPVRLIR